jgi:hypothetical protein
MSLGSGKVTKTLPSLDQKCGANFLYRDFIECSDAYQKHRPHNVPRSIDTYEALKVLAKNVLDPVVVEFGKIKLTYGVSCPELTRIISKGISPPHDQHASYEMNSRDRYICSRLGAAVDFLTQEYDSLSVAKWIVTNCEYDRLYVYGADRPIHVSVGPEDKKHIVMMRKSEVGAGRVPRLIKVEKFLQLAAEDI